MAIELSDIQYLDDDELFEKLRVFQKGIGPVVDSTRSVYQTMLYNELKEMEVSHDGNGVAVEFNNSSDVITSYEEKPRRSVSRPPVDLEPPLQATPSPHVFKRWSEVDDPFNSEFFDDAAYLRSRVNIKSRPPTRLYDTPFIKPEKKGFSIIKTLLLSIFVFGLAGFIIFVATQSSDPYKNIESEAGDVDTAP